MTLTHQILYFKSSGTRKSISIVVLGITIGYLFTSYRDLRQVNELKDIDVGIDFEAHNWNERLHMHRNNSLKQKLNDEIRILCWIMTSPDNIWLRARHIERTWGQRCNKLLIMSSKPDDRLSNVIALPVHESPNHLWAKTKEAFKYIYAHHLNDFDWVYKADDDTYTIMENLRFMLYPHSPSYPVYFDGGVEGSAGYVLSKEAVRRFVEIALPDRTKCRQDAAGAEDIELGKCLKNFNVTKGNSRDSDGLGRFFPFVPNNHYYKTVDEGVTAASELAIAFHYITPRLMYVLEYLVYHLQPFGIVFEFEKLPSKLFLTDKSSIVDGNFTV